MNGAMLGSASAVRLRARARIGEKKSESCAEGRRRGRQRQACGLGRPEDSRLGLREDRAERAKRGYVRSTARWELKRREEAAAWASRSRPHVGDNGYGGGPARAGRGGSEGQGRKCKVGWSPNPRQLPSSARESPARICGGSSAVAGIASEMRQVQFARDRAIARRAQISGPPRLFELADEVKRSRASARNLIVFSAVTRADLHPDVTKRLAAFHAA